MKKFGTGVLTASALIIALLITLLMLISCSDNGNMSDATTDADSDSVTTSTTETTAEKSEPTTEETVTDEIITSDETSAEEITVDDTTVAETTAESDEKIEADAPEFLAGFGIRQYYKEKVTELDGSGKVTAGDLKFTFDYSSVFYGSESAVDHDTMHFGDIYVTNIVNRQIPPEFRCGEFSGDRKDEIINLADRTITIYQFYELSTKALNTVYTQTLGFDGVLCGTGDFNGDLYTDILIYSASGHVVEGIGGEGGFTFNDCGVLTHKDGTLLTGKLWTGDVNGDNIKDLIEINGTAITSYIKENGAYVLFAESKLINGAEYAACGVSDINSDGLADIGVAYSGNKYTLTTYFGRGNGSFGPMDESEAGNENLAPTYKFASGITISYLAGGDINNSDGVMDYAAVITDTKKGTTYMYSLSYPTIAPAYDYSAHVIQLDDGSYIMYTGTLYSDMRDEIETHDGDHIVAYTSKDGVIWHPVMDAPCFNTGAEIGYKDEWFCANSMEPEVIYVDGKYYMYFQVENYTNMENGERIGADKIGVAVSEDGFHFKVQTDAPVLTSDDPYAYIHHEEVIYVPDDPDGLCYWMYFHMNHNNVAAGTYRLRSADPLHFFLDTNVDEDSYSSGFRVNNAEAVSGFGGLGNQTGYINDVDGSRLFLRICCTGYSSDAGDQTTAGLQFSRDGLHWVTGSNIAFAGVDISDPYNEARPNFCFLGFSTYNGTGEIRPNADGSYTFYYIACTTQRAVAPQIFNSSEGVGRVDFTITVNK